MIKVSREVHFNAAHKLYNPKWSKEKNETVFGPCANENWHGHNFRLIVTIIGTVNPETGFVVDLKELKDLINKEVVNLVDHRNLNLDVPFMLGKMASCENLIIGIWEILAPRIKSITTNGALHNLTLYETPKNFVSYSGI